VRKKKVGFQKTGSVHRARFKTLLRHCFPGRQFSWKPTLNSVVVTLQHLNLMYRRQAQGGTKWASGCPLAVSFALPPSDLFRFTVLLPSATLL